MTLFLFLVENFVNDGWFGLTVGAFQCYNFVELGSFAVVFSVFTRTLYELSAKRKKKLLFLLLRPTKVVLYDHEPLKIYLPYKHPYFTSLEKFLGACFSSANIDSFNFYELK